jgi:hypothetical protein
MKNKVSATLVLMLSCNIPALAQDHLLSWKEYVYANDGFAVTLPYAPTPHPDPNNTNITVYTVHPSADISVSLRVVNETRDCASTLSTLKDGALHGRQPRQPIDPLSVKEFSVNGYPGVEYQFQSGPGHTTYDRYYCVTGKFYIFSADWAGNGAKPSAVTHIVNSFRLLSPGAHK